MGFFVFCFSFFILFYFIFYCNGRDGTFKSRCTSRCWGGRSSVKTLVISFSYQYFKRGVEKIAVYLVLLLACMYQTYFSVL